MKRATKVPPIYFTDLAAQQRRMRHDIELAIARVLDHGQYIMGPEVAKLEEELAMFCGSRYCVTCANGTDALELALLALNVKAGDAILLPSFTFAATAEIVPRLGATPVFTDVLADTFNIDPHSIRRGITEALQQGLHPAGIIAVDLFGQPADYDQILSIAADHKMWVVSDAAQSFGVVYRGRPVGRMGRITTTSFFPSKPLGCYGDGGAVFTDDEELASIIRSLRVHGQGKTKYENVRTGVNSRLDSIQAAILLAKFIRFPQELLERNKIAARYNSELGNKLRIPFIAENVTSTWAQYTVRLDNRDQTVQMLIDRGVPTAIYYPVPLHNMLPYCNFPRADHGLPASTKLSREVLSLPMHPWFDAGQQDYIIDCCLEVSYR